MRITGTFGIIVGDEEGRTGGYWSIRRKTRSTTAAPFHQFDVYVTGRNECMASLVLCVSLLLHDRLGDLHFELCCGVAREYMRSEESQYDNPQKLKTKLLIVMPISTWDSQGPTTRIAQSIRCQACWPGVDSVAFGRHLLERSNGSSEHFESVFGLEVTE